MAKFLELKKMEDGTRTITGLHDISPDGPAPAPSTGGDYCLRIPDQTYYILKAVNGDVAFALGLLNGVNKVLAGGRR